MFIIDKKFKSWFQKQTCILSWGYKFQKPLIFIFDSSEIDEHACKLCNSFALLLRNLWYFRLKQFSKSFSFSGLIMTSCWYIYSQTLVVSNNSMVLGRKTNNKQNNIPFLFHYHCTNNSHLLINVCQFVFKHTKSKRLCFKVFDERFDCTICILRFLQLSHSPSNPTLWMIFYICT